MFELRPQNLPKDEGTEEQSSQCADKERHWLDLQGKAFGMGGSAPHIAQQPKCQPRVRYACHGSQGRRNKHHAE